MAEARTSRPLQVVSRMGALSTVAAGLVGAGAVATVGPPLAMGLSIWSGGSTEPVMPHLAYPLLWHALAIALTAAGWVWSGRGGGGRATLLLHGGAVASVLVPIAALLRLVEAT